MIFLSGGASVFGIRPRSSGEYFVGVKKSSDARVLLIFPSHTKGRIRQGQSAEVQFTPACESRIRKAAQEAAQANSTVRLSVSLSEFSIIPDSRKWGKWRFECGRFVREHEEVNIAEEVTGEWIVSCTMPVCRSPESSYLPRTFEEAMAAGCPQAVIDSSLAAKAEYARKSEAARIEADRKAAEAEAIRKAGEPARLVKWENEVLPLIRSWMDRKDLESDLSLERNSSRGGDSLRITFDGQQFLLFEDEWSYTGSSTQNVPFDMDVIKRFYLSMDGTKVSIG